MAINLSALALATTVLSGACLAGVRIEAVEPTVLFPRAAPSHQIAVLTVISDEQEAKEYRFTATVKGGPSGPPEKVRITPGPNRVRVLVPDISTPAEVVFALALAGRAEPDLAVTRLWQPQRKWKVHIVKSSHEDLGYENYIFKKQHDIANFIDIAQNLSKSTENLSDLERKSDSKYHYTLESLLFHRNYVEERGERAWRDLVEKDLKTGNMFLMGAPSGVAPHWMDYEELARMTYPGRREMKDKYGLDLKTFMIVDNPSLSWSGAQVVAAAGFKYVARWGQGWRTGGNNNYATTKLPALFWWMAPDGKHKVLFGWRSHYGLSFWYGQTGGGYQNLVDLAGEHVSAQLKKVEDGSALGPYPFDALINPEYVDHDIPRIDGRVLPVWAQKYEYPEIHISSPDRFFDYIEKKYGPELPVLSGDLNNFSADYATIDPESQGQKRTAARLLPAAEGLGALASALDPGFMLPPAFVDRTYTRMFDFVEHSWPTLPPASDVQLFNAAWVKKAEGQRVLEAAEKAVDLSAKSLSTQIRTGPERTLVVFNTLAHPRSGLVKVTGDIPALADLSNGKPVACQKTAEGETVFVARDVPAFGYKLYRIESRPAQGNAAFTLGDDFLANEYYAVRFDPKSGAVRSIVEKESGRELIDSSAPYLANQMVYVQKESRESTKGFEYAPSNPRRMEGRQGPVFAEFSAWIDDPKTQAAIRQTVVLYAGLKRVDFVNKLDHVRTLFSKSYEDRYRENIFYSFPFAVPGGQARVEYPGGVVRPYEDQLRWGSHDFLHANRWVDVSNGQHGVTLVPWNAATFHFGEIRYNQFSIDYKPKKPWLYSFAWSNRMSELLTLNGDDCNAVLGYSMTSHQGDWDAGTTTRFAWETATPLIPRILDPNPAGRLTEASKSFLSLDAANVQLTVLKQSEQPGRGWVARLVETQGRETELLLDVRTLKIMKAYECDLVENDRHPLEIQSGKVRARIQPFGFLTLRLEGGQAPGEVQGLKASVAGDDAVRLNWNETPSAVAYNVYRSDDPDAPPTAHTLVARTSKAGFEDRGLHTKTRYYYRVAALGNGNLQGAASSPMQVLPDGPNRTPPAPVSEFGVVRRSKDTLMVYWRTNPEPDVARYRLYRGDRPDFNTEGQNPLATIEPARYFLQLYVDRNLDPGKQYFYKVFAEDWAGNRQPVSTTASAKTPAY